MSWLTLSSCIDQKLVQFHHCLIIYSYFKYDVTTCELAAVISGEISCTLSIFMSVFTHNTGSWQSSYQEWSGFPPIWVTLISKLNFLLSTTKLENLSFVRWSTPEMPAWIFILPTYIFDLSSCSRKHWISAAGRVLANSIPNHAAAQRKRDTRTVGTVTFAAMSISSCSCITGFAQITVFTQHDCFLDKNLGARLHFKQNKNDYFDTALGPLQHYSCPVSVHLL